MQVRIANGDMVSSEGKCNTATIQIQGTDFVTNLFTLELKCCDIVLGVQWLLSLGPILWDFGKLNMKFTYKSSFTCLRGLSSACSSLVDVVEVAKISRMEHKGLLLQIVIVQSQRGYS